MHVSFAETGSHWLWKQFGSHKPQCTILKQFLPTVGEFSQSAQSLQLKNLHPVTKRTTQMGCTQSIYSSKHTCSLFVQETIQITHLISIINILILNILQCIN